jgi:hypothetical protein
VPKTVAPRPLPALSQKEKTTEKIGAKINAATQALQEPEKPRPPLLITLG